MWQRERLPVPGLGYNLGYNLMIARGPEYPSKLFRGAEDRAERRRILCRTLNNGIRRAGDASRVRATA